MLKDLIIVSAHGIEMQFASIGSVRRRDFIFDPNEDGTIKPIIWEMRVDSLLNWALKSALRNHNGIVYHVPNRPEFWIDSIYMLPPYLAAAGHPKEALHQIYGYRTALFDRQTVRTAQAS